MAIMMEDKSVEVLAGVNLPMIVNAALEREGVDAKNFFLSYTILARVVFKIYANNWL